MSKLRVWSLPNCAVVSLSKPVVSSFTPPVALVYLSKASLAIRTRVVPVSTIPAVSDKIAVFAVPYVMLSLMPQNSFAGEVVAERKIRQIGVLKKHIDETTHCEERM